MSLSGSLGVRHVGLFTWVLTGVVRCQGDEGNMPRVVLWGVHVWLGPPYKFKSDRFIVTHGYESLGHRVTSQ